MVEESARTLADVVDRRLTLGTLGKVDAQSLGRVGELVAVLLGWDEARRQGEVADYLGRQERRSRVLDAAFKIGRASCRERV